MRAALIALIALLAASALLGCGRGECRTVATDRRDTTGTVTYRTAEGTEFSANSASVWAVSDSTLTLTADLEAASGDTRAVSIELHGLRAGSTATLAAGASGASGEACLVVASNAPKTCFPLDGSIDVKTLATNCYNHESGVSLCVEDVDASLHLSADAQGLTLKIDLDVTSAEHWTDTQCSD